MLTNPNNATGDASYEHAQRTHDVMLVSTIALWCLCSNASESAAGILSSAAYRRRQRQQESAGARRGQPRESCRHPSAGHAGLACL
jgi:hypothetical protein